MNKRFFTLMAAVMLAGAPLCNEAFAVTTYETAAIADAPLANGTKFVLLNSGNAMKVSVVKDGDNVYVKNAGTAGEEAIFEVANFQKSELGVTFNLVVNGNKFAVDRSSLNPKAKFVTTFTVDLTTPANGYKVGNINEIKPVYDGAALGTLAWTPATKAETYNQTELTDFNITGTTFSFGEGVEGNIFDGLTPITVSGKTYFVSGAKADVDAFAGVFAGTFTDAIKAAAKKLSFAAVTNEKWGLNTSAAGEGYKLALVNGASFYGDKALAADNILFTSIKEADQLNNEGEVEMAISPKFEGAAIPVTIKSVKASASDTKTYVTTVATASLYYKVANPILGANSYFAASEFLKAGEVSAYNIYATSGVAGAAGSEYHKYYVNTSNGSAFASSFEAQQDVDLTNPSAQWIATGFNGKYTLTLKNRLNPTESLVLKLTATNNAGEYTVSGASALAGKTVKLLPAALTKYDGSLELSEEQIKEGVTLSFSGKNAAIGEQTFFLTEDASASKLVPTLDASKAAKLNVAKAVDAKKQDLAMNITQYAYLDAAGAVVVADEAKADTLVVPAYQFSYDKAGTKYVVKDLFTLATGTGATADYYMINKTMNGDYTVTYSVAAPAYATHAQADNNAVGVAATVTGSTVVANFALPTKYFAPAETGFASLAVDANDNYDYASLPAVSRHATFENALGAVSFQENKNGILEGILSAEPATFWLDTADSETNVPTFYISKGIKAAEETKAYSDEVRNFLVYAPDSLTYFDEASATIKTNAAYVLEGTTDLKAFFHPAALVAEDTMTTVFDGKEVAVVAKKTKAGQVAALKNFQFGIRLADENVADEYVIYSKKDASKYLYSHNGKLGFGTDKQALIVKLGEGDATANEAIAAENVAVIAGEGVVTVKGAAGKQVVVSNILGQVIANKVATSDEETIAVAAGVAVVVVDGEATKVVVK